MSRARGHRRQWRYRKPAELSQIEEAYAAVRAQRGRHSGTPGPSCAGPPLGLFFPNGASWRTWLARAEEVCPGLDLLIVTSHHPEDEGILVLFQHRCGGWLDGASVEELMTLTHSGRAGHGQRTMSEDATGLAAASQDLAGR